MSSQIGKVQTDGQTQSDAHEPTVQYAQVAEPTMQYAQVGSINGVRQLAAVNLKQLLNTYSWMCGTSKVVFF